MTDQKQSRALAEIKAAPSLAQFRKEDLIEAFKAALPNSEQLSTAQIAGAAVAAQATDLNPINKEFYITQKGTMPAAKSDLAAVNEWLREGGEGDLDWTYVGIGQLEADDARKWLASFGIYADADASPASLVPLLLEKLDVNPSCDIAILVRAWKPKAQDRHMAQIRELRSLGFTPAEIKESLGSLKAQPAHEAWSIVRFSEAKEVKDQKGKVVKTQAEAWQEMNAKYSPLERAKKRGRSACAKSIAPVTIAMQRRMREGKRVITEQRVVSTQATPEEAFTVKASDIVYAAGVTINDTHAPIDADVIQESAHASEAQIDDEPEAFSGDADHEPEAREEVETPKRDRDDGMPGEMIALRRAIDAKAQQYAEEGLDADEKMRRWVWAMSFMDVMKGAKKPDQSKVIEYLTGFDRWPDVPGSYVRALKDVWLRPEKKEGDKWPVPCDAARQSAQVIARRYKPEA